MESKQSDEEDYASLSELYDELTDQMGKHDLSSLNAYLMIKLQSIHWFVYCKVN